MIGGAGDTELAYAAGCAVFEELLDHGLLEHIASVGKYLEEQFVQLQKQSGQISHVCCKGLAASIEFSDREVFESVQKKMKENRLIAGTAEYNKIVLRPPYVITEEDVDEVVAVLRGILR